MSVEIAIRVCGLLCDLLDEADRCISETSKLFLDHLEREKAKGIVDKYGRILSFNQPLGYGNYQAYVVFEDSCPNNTFPIFWPVPNNWLPLFKQT